MKKRQKKKILIVFILIILLIFMIFSFLFFSIYPLKKLSFSPITSSTGDCPGDYLREFTINFYNFCPGHNPSPWIMADLRGYPECFQCYDIRYFGYFGSHIIETCPIGYYVKDGICKPLCGNGICNANKGECDTCPRDCPILFSPDGDVLLSPPECPPKNQVKCDGTIKSDGTKVGYCNGDTHTCCPNEKVCCPKENGGRCESKWGFYFCTHDTCPVGYFQCKGIDSLEKKTICCKNDKELCVHADYGLPVCVDKPKSGLPKCPVDMPVTVECECYKDPDEVGMAICQPGEKCVLGNVEYEPKTCVPSSCDSTKGEHLCTGREDYRNMVVCCTSTQYCILDGEGFPKCQ